MISLTKKYCENILLNSTCKTLPFHNISHTTEVVNQVQIIGNNLNFSAKEMEPIIIAAWFHDVGFCDAYKGHEKVSMEMANHFLSQNNYPPEKIDVVLSCIRATMIPQNPENKYAEIMSDADIFHISTDNFFYRKLLLRREWELVFKKTSSDTEWHILNLEFLQNHQFFTTYGKEVLMKGQMKNEEKVKNLIFLYK